MHLTEPSLNIERPGELEAYLRRTGRIAASERVSISALPGGVSNRTMLLERTGGEPWVVKQALPRLRVAVEWRCDPRRIEREALAIRRLTELAPPGSIAPLVFLDADQHLLAMQAVPQPHENWKELLLAGKLDLGHVRQFAELLASIHSGGWLRREQLAVEFADRSFFESLRLEPYYTYTAGRVPAAASFLTDLVEQTLARRDTLVHGDYSPKNVLVYRDRLVLLDHEVAHFGDAAFDLSFALTHLLSKAHHLVALRGDFAEAAAAFWRVYRESLVEVPWAGELEARAVRHTLACLLARVAGRSPLEYLDQPHRQYQQAAAVNLMSQPPATVEALVAAFLARIADKG